MFISQMLAGIAETWQEKVTDAVENILVPILVIACSVGMIWAIVIGIKMMKADSADKRNEAKAQLINIAISLVAIAVLIGLFYAIKTWLLENETTAGGQFEGLWDPNKNGFIGNTLSLVKQCVSLAIFKC